MIALDHKYWQDRYENKRTGWDLGIVSRPIKDYIDQLENKKLKILIPGAGNSHEAQYLYDKGFTNIHILDIVKAPLKYAQHQLPHLPDSSFIHKNFFEHKGSYDLIIEQTFFCALEKRFRESYVKQTYQLLKNHGKLVGVLFNFQEARKEPPYGGSTEEYQSLFNPFYRIIKMDNCYNSSQSRIGKELFIKLEKKINGN